MKDELISLYIDDELSLDEKKGFVELVHADRTFKDRTLAFLDLEKDLRSEVAERVPEIAAPPVRAAGRPSRLLRPLFLAAAAAAAIVAAVLFWPGRQQVGPADTGESYRFVIYRPGITQAEITGDFTGWKRITMERVGTSGYWEISLPLQPGEHRYVFIIDGGQRIADPTVMDREQDDFGGENSILVTGGSV